MVEFDGHPHPFYSCRNCLNPLALHDDLISKSYLVKSGKGYMFAQAMNVVLGRREDKKMLTGVYTIANIYCGKCGEELGWQYLQAHDFKQKFKEGSFIIEKLKMIKVY
ncbi:hypothetical protein Patl1_05226 [Pistacia atlantica]|uniref:Uncharacterized protein n=1 Tax=Pistacia atlantica TaxID=434234 RepID=A0ACC1BUM0_9ROSI|nr:hypothetical protein Patl1_05226 [Pistacia atlantica]